jgi:hypothetical protein
MKTNYLVAFTCGLFLVSCGSGSVNQPVKTETSGVTKVQCQSASVEHKKTCHGGDWAQHHLFGKVKTVKGADFRIHFSERGIELDSNGNELGETGREEEGSPLVYSITRDPQNGNRRVAEIQENPDECMRWNFSYVYDEDGRLISDTVITEGVIEIVTYTFDENGHVKKVVTMDSEGDISDAKIVQSIVYYIREVDEQGNWTEREAHVSDGTKFTETRSIEYY